MHLIMALKTSRRSGKLPALAILASVAPPLGATDIEPRAYSNIPVGMNFLLAGYGYTKGNISFAPTVPITNGRLEIHNSVFAYARSLDIWGRSGKVDIIVPQAWLSGQAEVLGQARSRDISGFADPIFRGYVNLFGAPALSLKDYANYQQDTIVGLSLAASVPGGQYDPQKLVNLGTNRWSFKPEIGISKAAGPLTFEFAAGAFFFTDNDQPFRGKSLAQDPIYALQGHVIYSLGMGVWGALDANFYAGGRTTKDGRVGDDYQQNARVGATLALPIDRHNSIKLYGSTSVYSLTGSKFDTMGMMWQYRWGEGF